MKKSEILLSTGARFIVEHNLEDLGLSIESALNNWLARTTEFTPDSFCEYIKSKDPINIKANHHEIF